MDVRVGLKKAEHRRIDAFELWCWRRLLRVPWTARRSNKSILKGISPEYSLKGLMLKLKLQYFATWCEEVTHLKRPSCWERLKARGEGDNRGLDGWMASPTWWTWVWVSSGNWWWTGKPGVLQSMGSQRFGHDWATELNPSQLAQVVKNSPANAGDTGWILGLGRSPREGNGNPFQYYCLENPWTGSLAGYSPWGHKELNNWTCTHTHTHTHTRAHTYVITKIKQSWGLPWWFSD